MPFFSKPFAFLAKSTTLSLVLLTAATVTQETLAENPRILDLSQDFPVANVHNTDAATFEKLLTRNVRRFLVIDDGEIVMNYQRDTVEDDEVFDLWSATKTFTTLMIGSIVYSDEYDLSMDDTLGEIFTGENDWNDVTDPAELEFKQNVTIFDLLTMTSGLQSTHDVLNLNPLKPFDIPNSAGINLKQSLSDHTWNATMKGEFVYMPISNVLSYVVVAVTGMTPFEYSSIHIFPFLGIDPDKIKWDKNFAGVETALSSLKMTAKDMAKIGQLFLQKGKSAPDKQLIPEEFVEDSLVPKDVLFFGAPAVYGLGWWYVAFNKTTHPDNLGEGIWGGSGFLGQGFYFNYESKRVIAYQTSNTLYDAANNGTDLVMHAVFGRNVTWDIPIEQEVDESDESDESNAFSLSMFLVAVSAVVPCILFWI